MEGSLWVHGDNTIGIIGGYNEDSVEIQWEYSEDTVGIQRGYSRDTVRIQVYTAGIQSGRGERKKRREYKYHDLFFALFSSYAVR